MHFIDDNQKKLEDSRRLLEEAIKKTESPLETYEKNIAHLVRQLFGFILVLNASNELDFI